MTDLPAAVHAVEAEQQLLGCVLLNNDVLDRVAGIVEEEHFVEPVHAALWKIMGDLIAAGRIASPVSLKPRVADVPGLKDLGGPAYLVNMAGAATMPGQAIEYARVVRDVAMRRAVLMLGDDMQRRAAQSDGGEVSEILSRAETEIAVIQRSAGLRAPSRSWMGTMNDTLADVARGLRGVSLGTSTGFERIDEVTGGLRPGTSFVVAGRPGMGKSALAVQIATNLARRGDGVLFVSAEMPAQSLGARAIASLLAEGGTSIPYESILNARLDDAQARQVAEAAQAQRDWPLEVGNVGMASTTALGTSVRRLKRAWGDRLKLVVVDHIGLVQAPGLTKTIDRVSEVSLTCKRLALEHGICVMPLAQLSRQVETRDNKRPVLSDLRDSGRIEEDADVVLFPYREAYYAERAVQAAPQHDVEAMADAEDALARVRDDMTLIFAKVRDGRTDVRTVRADMGVNLIRDINPGGYR